MLYTVRLIACTAAAADKLFVRIDGRRQQLTAAAVL